MQFDITKYPKKLGEELTGVSETEENRSVDVKNNFFQFSVEHEEKSFPFTSEHTLQSENEFTRSK